ncbi:MAG: acylneuraminate cytidylyltransferase family protein [Bacteroides sp.]
MKALFLIPARGGSKGIPHKNIKLLGGKPLIAYAIDAARQVAPSDADICVSTDDEEIIRVTESLGLKVPFRRPAELAQDGSGTYEVILQALDYYAAQGIVYDVVVLLQPTSPFRTAAHIREAMERYDPSCDMVVSVTPAQSNPYYVMFQEDASGYLQHVLEGRFTTRQECPVVYEYNGAVYVMNVDALRASPLSAFKRNRKYVMPAAASTDLDTQEDWRYAEFRIEKYGKQESLLHPKATAPKE